MQRNHFIDILKGILIIFVVVAHFSFTEEERQGMLFPFWIDMAVPCFMLISGYVSALSFQKREVTHFKVAYRLDILIPKILRFVVPFTIAFIAEWIVFRLFKVYIVGIRSYGILALVFDYLRGGKGQGSYYFPVMIQFIFLFPVIFFLIRKYNWKGLIYCFGLNVLYEILKTAYCMNETEYRLLLFRYMFVIAAGCYLAFANFEKSCKEKVIALISITVGLFFIYLFSYTNYQPKIVTYWTNTSFLTCLFIIPILYFLIRQVNISFKPMEIIGKASFHIFLIQMIYYNFEEKMHEMISTKGGYFYLIL